MADDSDRKEAPATFPIYVGADEKELVEWIEDRVDSPDYHNYSHLFIKGLKTLRREESEEIL